MKVAPLVDEIQRKQAEAILVHTGQHFSAEMSDAFFRDLEMPVPDFNLGVGTIGSPVQQIAAIMQAFEPILLQVKPDVVIVVGDVNSTLAASIVANKCGVPLAHVEAGLRSFDRRMPEEINRLATDAISDFLFVTEPSGKQNLLNEGVSAERIHFVGNVMIDTLLKFRKKASGSKVLETLHLEPNSYGTVTLHRPSNVDDPEQLKSLVETLNEISSDLPLVFPMHPRTRAKLGTSSPFGSGVTICDPLGYLDFLHLVSNSRLVLTDSGGIQEETTILRVPCVTLRENTERPITIDQGTNRLAGIHPRDIVAAAREALDTDYANKPSPEMWDGQASQRIIAILDQKLR